MAQPNNYMTLSEFQKVHSQMKHISVALPSLRGLMTPLNQVLQSRPSTISPKRGGAVGDTFKLFTTLIEEAQHLPSHITKLIAPSLPRFYSTMDASGDGAGGVCLPQTLGQRDPVG